MPTGCKEVVYLSFPEPTGFHFSLDFQGFMKRQEDDPQDAKDSLVFIFLSLTFRITLATPRLEKRQRNTGRHNSCVWKSITCIHLFYSRSIPFHFQIVFSSKRQRL
jgi:hypothetical protein